RPAVTTLAAAASLCSGRIALDVEIKQPGIERSVIEALRSGLDPEQLVMTAFRESSLAAVKRCEPAIACGLLVGPARMRARTKGLDPAPFESLARAGGEF